MKPRTSRALPLALLLSCCACYSSLGVAYNRLVHPSSPEAQKCYSSCRYPGTACNKDTGLCEPLPCRGECDPYQECVDSRCVPRNTATIPPGTSSTKEEPPAGSKAPGSTP